MKKKTLKNEINFDTLSVQNSFTTIQWNIAIYKTFKVVGYWVKVKNFWKYNNIWLDIYVKKFYTNSSSKLNCLKIGLIICLYFFLKKKKKKKISLFWEAYRKLFLEKAEVAEDR